MTTLDRLQIQGIRSYGASEPAQNIDFKPPLTLILGPNGSGKTTIIECLRMVCTGVWPPNGTGAPFLNDPKVAIHHTAQTKGQIKMRFRTQQGVLVTVGKLFQLTNKKGDKQEGKKIKQTFEIGAGSSSTTNRCTDMPDMDTRVPELMGVSPAVLKSVIFCHQEEANWVLGEPKILKDNFDAIFASSRYSQALEAIKKLQKEQHDVIKRLEGDVNELSIHKKQAQELRKDKTDAQEETDQLNDQIKELNLQVKETEKQRNICSTALANLEENAQRKAELDTELRVLVSQYDQMDEALKECKEDVEALKGRIKQCKTELGSSNKEKQALSKNIKLRERDAEKCQKAVTKLKDAEATYRAEQMVQKKREDGQQVLATELSNRYQMGTGIGTTSIGSSYSAVCTRMNEICSHKEAELQRLKEEHELKERLVSETLGEKQRQMDRTEHELKEKKKRAGEKRDQVESLRSEIQKTKPPLGALEEAAAEEEVCSNLLNILAGKDAEHVRKIAQLEAKEKDLEEERGEKKELKRKADGDFNQAEMLNKMKREYERHKEKVKGAISKEESRLVAELGQIPPLAELSSSLSSVVADRSRTVGLETSKSAQVKAQLNQLREMALDKTSQIRDLAVKIRTLTEEASKVTCEGTPIEAWEEARSAALPIKEVLLRLEMQKTEKQSRMQLLTMYTLFKRDAARDQHCPLCKRGYDHHDELDEFLRSLDEIMENAPAEEQKARKQAERLNQEVEVLRSIQGKLNETEGLEERKRDAEKQLEDITQQLGDKEQEEFQIDEGLDRGQSALREAEELQALVRELDVAGMLRLEQEIEEEEAQSEGKGTGWPFAMEPELHIC